MKLTNNGIEKKRNIWFLTSSQFNALINSGIESEQLGTYLNSLGSLKNKLAGSDIIDIAVTQYSVGLYYGKNILPNFKDIDAGMADEGVTSIKIERAIAEVKRFDSNKELMRLNKFYVKECSQDIVIVMLREGLDVTPDLLSSEASGWSLVPEPDLPKAVVKSIYMVYGYSLVHFKDVIAKTSFEDPTTISFGGLLKHL